MFGWKKRAALLEQAQENLTKTQENLERTQENLEKLFRPEGAPPLEVLVTRAPDMVVEKTKEEKAKAAYALNLCTVSVSQIVEYDDVRTLDQEYSTILNNLNLQNMPEDKEGALLSILKQLLNVITFFKIQEGDKEMLEKEYQHKMKNAIWKAVPNMSVVLTTPDPKVMLFNLATQIGIGYMNYRREKAETQLESEKQKWQLKRSAMEQINGLRRELFETAWRLSKEYDFDDALRLSERQIEQYNQILLDDVPKRKYERLLAIKNTFAAFPPFWYYLGHTAAEIEKVPEAKEAFYEFLRLTGNKTARSREVLESNQLLREDHLCASCALELAGLMSYDKEEMLALLEIAVKSSGCAPDVLQMCAMAYICITDKEKAIAILRYLVNENYNVDLNANLLSKLYCEEHLANKIGAYLAYKELREREDVGMYMLDIPAVIPDEAGARDVIVREYYEVQREELIDKKNYVLRRFEERVRRSFLNLCRETGDIQNEMEVFLCDFREKGLALFSKTETFVNVEEEIAKRARKPENKIHDFISDASARMREAEDFYKAVVGGVFEEFDRRLDNAVKKAENEKIFRLSYAFDTFCITIGVRPFTRVSFVMKEDGNDAFLATIFDPQKREENKKKMSRREICLSVIQKYKDLLVSPLEEKHVTFTVFDETDFCAYTKRHAKLIETMNLDWSADEVIAVLNDKTSKDHDLIFTTQRCFMVSHAIHAFFAKSVTKENSVLYTDGFGSSKRNKTITVGKKEFHTEYVDLDRLREMVKELGEKATQI